MNDGAGALDGVLVLDFSRVLAGPLATQRLADAGARVIKVESPDGDPTRGWGPPFVGEEAAYFLAWNRNKESVVCDLRREEDRRLVRAMVRRCDVVVENFAPGQGRKLGIEESSLRPLRPDLIWASLTGFPPSSPHGDLPAYDLLIQAMSGWMSVTGEESGEATKVGLPLVDIVAGLELYGAICAALVRRSRGGGGGRLDVSLLDSALAALGHLAVSARATGQPCRRFGNGHPNIVPYQTFRGSDRPFALAVGTEPQWGRLCEDVLQRPDLAVDSRFRRNSDRVANRKELVRILEVRFAERPAAEWIARCRAARIPAGGIAGILEALSLSTADDGGLTRVVDEQGRLELPGQPVRTGSRRNPQRPPRLDENGSDLRREFLSAEAGGESDSCP